MFAFPGRRTLALLAFLGAAACNSDYSTYSTKIAPIVQISQSLMLNCDSYANSDDYKNQLWSWTTSGCSDCGVFPGSSAISSRARFTAGLTSGTVNVTCTVNFDPKTVKQTCGGCGRSETFTTFSIIIQ